MTLAGDFRETGPVIGVQPKPENLPVIHIDSIAGNSLKMQGFFPKDGSVAFMNI